jgi:signal transduction histidine kinase
MKRNLPGLSRRYQAALREHLKGTRRATLLPARRLGHWAMSLGLETLELVRLHEQALITLVLPSYSAGTREGMVRRAGAFFAEAFTPLEQTHRTAREANLQLSRVNRSLCERSASLAAANLQLKQEIARRESVEASLKEREQHYGLLLEQSRQMQEQLRLLSRQLLSAQEEERKRISRELHDVIAQTLTSINGRLAALKQDAALNLKGLARSIARTQRLVARSVNIVHRFARELRPTVLDDLGLLPALHTFLENFKQQSGIRVSLSAFAAVEQVTGAKRTVLFRVAQEALTNVARHARASRAAVLIQQVGGTVCMTIKDNGQGFRQSSGLDPRQRQQLGLLGMRERLDMVRGYFTVTSAPGKGTTVLAQIPLLEPAGSGGQRHAHETN